MKRRIIALMLAGILSISSLGGVDVYAVEDGETESQTESNVETDTEENIPIETETKESVFVETETEEETKESLVETEEALETQSDVKGIMNAQEELDTGNVAASDSEPDVTAPEIDVDSLNVDVKSAGLGDKVKISLKVTDDESGVNNVYVFYSNPQTKQDEAVILKYNSVTGNYEKTLSITDSTVVGVWQVSFIYVTDMDGNLKTLSNEKIKPNSPSKANLEAGDYEVFRDEEAPTYSEDSLKISKDKIGVNETMEITFSATDVHGISSARIVYEKPVSGTECELECSYDELSGVYKAVMEVGTYMEAGQWKVKKIVVEDNYGNVLNLHNSSMVPDAGSTADLDSGNFIVEGTEEDLNSPKIDETSISVEGTALAVGDSYCVSLKVTDDLSGVDKVVAQYLMPNGKSYKLVLEASEGNLYKGSFLCEESTLEGRWTAQTIEATDKAGNKVILEKNLDALSFTVYKCSVESLRLESGNDVVLEYSSTDVNTYYTVEFAAQNTDHVLCNKSAVSTTILGDGSRVYTVKYTLMPRAEGSTIIEVRDSSTKKVYKVYDTTVDQANYSGCMGQDIVLRFSAGIGQYYTLSSGSEYGTIKTQSYRKTSSSGMFGVLEAYTNECMLHFDSVGKYNIVLTGDVSGDSVVLSIDIGEHDWNTEYTVDKLPTCTEKGSKSIHCKVCDSIKSDSMENIDAKGHVPGDWEILWSATEDTDGTRVKYCQVCKKEAERESIPKIATYYVTYDANGGTLPITNDAGEAYTTYPVRERVGDKHRIEFNYFFYHPEWDYTVTCHGNGEGANTIDYQSSFQFLGWNTKKDGSGTFYKVEDYTSLEEATYSGNKNITLYAQWATRYFEERYVERPGYVFKGWYTQKQGGKKVTSKTVIKGDTDVYAQWEPGKFLLDAKQIFVDIGDIKTITASVTSGQEDFDVSCTWDGGTQDRQIIHADRYLNTVSVQGLHEGEANVYVSIKNSGVYLPPGVSKEAQCKVIVKGFAWRLYETLLKRDADIAGWRAWLQQLDTGAITGAQAAEGFIFSDEFVNQNLSNDEFVERMYTTFLNRPSDPKGKAEWVNCLESGVSRRGIFYGFAESWEFTQLCDKYGIIRGSVELTEARDRNVGITKFISRLYTKALGRNTDVQGLNAWADVILSGRETPEKVAFGILFSDEFKNKGLSNEEYLNVLYRVFMGREADPVGLAAWKKMLDEGWRRDVIFYGFSKSDEFSEILGSFGLQQTVGEAVYVTRTDAKYHTANCSKIRDNQTNVLLLQDARSIGYEVCPECH